jgi:hypothetical protein
MTPYKTYLAHIRNCILKESGKECAKLLSAHSKAVKAEELHVVNLEVWQRKCQNFMKPFDQLIPYRLNVLNYIIQHDWERAYESQSLLVQYPFRIYIVMLQ